MLSFLAITEAVKGVVEERYPGNTVYMERVPVDFARPSFLVELGPVEMLDASCGCLEVKATVVVTAFVEADDYYNSHVPDLMTRMGAVQELFAVDGLQVEDRFLHVTANKGNCQFDYAETSITFQYQDDRPVKPGGGRRENEAKQISGGQPDGAKRSFFRRRGGEDEQRNGADIRLLADGAK